ncbi:hypothetical protein SAMN04515617_104214 [Collimonas sp. OK242]|nr:hypothetical protein SAMN04515617_104214 [Collimonas sp. OK242]
MPWAVSAAGLFSVHDKYREHPIRMLSFHQAGQIYSAVLIVPFGSKVVTEPFCTTTSVPLAISRVM